MAEVGKWGVTRDETGELASLQIWPWYWRYPGAVLIGVIGLILVYFAETRGLHEWVQWVLGIGAALFALSVAYELGLVALSLGFLGGVWLLGETFLPDFSVGPTGTALLVGCFAYYAWWVANDARIKADKAIKVGKSQWAWLNQMELERSHGSENIYEEISQLRARVRALERAAEDPFGVA